MNYRPTLAIHVFSRV